MIRKLAAPARLLLVIFPALILGWVVGAFLPKGFDVIHDLDCVLWIFMAVCSVFLFRRDSGWPTLLVAIGSVARALTQIEVRFADYSMRGWIPADSPFWQQFILWDNVNGIVMLCFPVGFLWYILRAIRRA
jgi:hypothetical protein